MNYKSFPRQNLSYKKKDKQWRKDHLDWAESNGYFYNSSVRKSRRNKIINRNLIDGIIHMEDIISILNPLGITDSYNPEQIQHYPVINSKLNLLKGEESSRPYDFRVIITNPTSISEIEKSKKEEWKQRIIQEVQDTSITEEQFNQNIQRLDHYYNYEWKDLREIRANALLNHYTKELDVHVKFNDGFSNAHTYGEEVYLIDIVGGDVSLEVLDPVYISTYGNSRSSHIEDSDIIIIEQYWSKGKIYDTYYDILSKVDINKLESNKYDRLSNYSDQVGIDMQGAIINSLELFSDNFSAEYEDSDGNIKVLRLFWKSRRKIKRVKSYDQFTGEEIYDFYPEDYVINEDLGETEEIYWINEAWRGTKIGKDIYVDMRPCPVQFNSLTNPSRCHFGIIGELYNVNGGRPYSLVDMMKPLSYFYDIVHYKLNEAIINNWGSIMTFDKAKVPDNMGLEQWLYMIKAHHIKIEDSFKEGNIGAATGKLAGYLSQGEKSLLNADNGQYIGYLQNVLAYIKLELQELVGITKQREGQISNRETVGGVERATLQSSHITEWLFIKHNNLKKRVLEAILETAKIALRGRKYKFLYILPNGIEKLIEIDGDQFSEHDYGLVIEDDRYTQELKGKIDTLAQAALQNQTLSFSTILQLYTNSSLMAKQRYIERDEQERKQEAQSMQQQQNELAQQELAQRKKQEELKMQFEDQKNIRDNETKLMIAKLNRESILHDDEDNYNPYNLSKEELMEKIRQFDTKMKFENKKLDQEKQLKLKELSLRNDESIDNLKSK